jgi:hypothetical protein
VALALNKVDLAQGDWSRTFAKEAELPLRNRFFEEDPVPTDGGAALLARPGLTPLADCRKWSYSWNVLSAGCLQ